MTRRQVPTLDAERAVARVNQTFALHESFMPAKSPMKTGRLRGTAGVVTSEPSRYLVLPHLVAIAEEFSRWLLLTKTQSHVPRDRPVLEQLWVKVENQAEGRWEDHLNAWKDWHQLALASEPIYQDLQPFIQARNAIMHGLGHLTRKQVRGNQETAVRGLLKSVKIEVVGTALVVSAAAVSRCADACKRFVTELDLRAQRIN
jgi:hypothetical protein